MLFVSIMNFILLIILFIFIISVKEQSKEKYKDLKRKLFERDKNFDRYRNTIGNNLDAIREYLKVKVVYQEEKIFLKKNEGIKNEHLHLL